MFDEQWSKLYTECQECGTTEVPHRGRGLCKDCYWEDWYYEKRATDQSWVDKRIEYAREYAKKRREESPKQKRGKSQFPGVSYVGSRVGRKKKWRAQIRLNGAQIYLGMFLTEEEAYEAYLNAQKGEYNLENKNWRTNSGSGPRERSPNELHQDAGEI